MRRLWIVALLAVLAAGVARGQQGTGARTSASVQLEAAIKKEVVDGDVKAAIELYRKLAKSSDRALAAQALLRMAECYQKLGDTQAQKIYEQIVREYADQKETVTLARARIGGSARPGPSSAFGLLCEGCGDPEASLSRDGRWMAMTEWDEGGDLAIRDMATGQVTRLLVKPGSWKDSDEFAEAPVLSPDTQQIAYAWGTDRPTGGPGQLRIIARERGAKPRTLLDNPEFVWPSPVAWSADGTQVLTELEKQDKTQQLAWVSIADGTVKMLKSLEWRIPVPHYRPTVSPDGRFIAYSAKAVNPTNAPAAKPDSTEEHLYILAADGSSDTELTKTAGIDEAPVWTPDSSFLLFRSDRTGSFDLWALPMREGKAAGLPSLVKRDIGRGWALGITNSGAYVYFQGHSGVDQVFVAQLDTTGKLPASVRLTESFVGRYPSWSPDGKFLEFAKPLPDGLNFNLVLHATDTGKEQLFARPGLRPFDVSWLHDSTGFLAKVVPPDARSLDDPTISIYAIDAKTGAFREVIGPNTRSGVAGLSPDDKTLYQCARDPARPQVFNRVVAVDLATGQERVILSLTGPSEALPGHIALALTPDGRTLAMAVCDQKSGECRLTRVGVDGTGHRDVFGPFKVNLRPYGKLAWTKDGRAMLFATQEGTKGRLMRVNADGGQPEFTGLEMDLRTDWIFSVSPDGSRVAFSSSTAQAPKHELRALDVSSWLKRPR